MFGSQTVDERDELADIDRLDWLARGHRDLASVRRAESDVTCSGLPPAHPVPARHRLQVLNPPILLVAPHSRQDFGRIPHW